MLASVYVEATVAAAHFPPRHLALIDGENLAGCRAPTIQEARRSVRAFWSIEGHGPAMQVVVASSHHNAGVISFAWPGARYRWRSGQNGADLALIDVILNEGVADRFGTVTVGSGDGIFLPAVEALTNRGVRVRIVGRPGGIATTLRLAAHEVIELAVAEHAPLEGYVA